MYIKWIAHDKERIERGDSHNVKQYVGKNPQHEIQTCFTNQKNRTKNPIDCMTNQLRFTEQNKKPNRLYDLSSKIYRTEQKTQ